MHSLSFYHGHFSKLISQQIVYIEDKGYILIVLFPCITAFSLSFCNMWYILHQVFMSEVCACVSLSVCVHRPIHRYVCAWWAPTFGVASKSASPLWTLSTCQNQGCELFPRYPWWVLASSRGYHTWELCREGSLALANKHMHMPPLTHSVPSNLHAVMRFFIIWHSKIIFLMYDRAWLGFTFKDFVFITSFFW